MPIDYSKWDHIDDSDDDESETNETSAVPRVTRLDAPSQVTFGGGGDNEAINIQQLTSAALPTNSPVLTSTSSAEPSSATPTAKASVNESNTWVQHGGMVTTDQDRKLYWCQDRYSIALRLELKPEEKVSRVTVDGILSYRDRHAAMGTHKQHLKCVGKSGTTDTVLLEGDLPHPVHLAEDDEGVDWSIVRDSHNTRYLLITMYKAVPMLGVFLWWKRPLMQFTEVDIEGDHKNTAASQEFLSAWEEAHKMFREKRQQEQSKGEPSS
ncbi:hypothetical protein IV203_014914 [Nitzschia inconspicua]|uniref:Uncharacterized protein n=1 Tax=Nitzschia inconspicua TaxID=303405 RepID=A0A9K3LBR6_9STRA|nr:hypothetical protein IV203_014914 [Nitzschia inconspicua]